MSLLPASQPTHPGRLTTTSIETASPGSNFHFGRTRPSSSLTGIGLPPGPVAWTLWTSPPNASVSSWASPEELPLSEEPVRAKAEATKAIDEKQHGADRDQRDEMPAAGGFSSLGEGVLSSSLVPTVSTIRIGGPGNWVEPRSGKIFSVRSSFGDLAAISFDGDGTLWDFQSSMRTALARSAEALAEAGLLRQGGPITAEWLAQVRDEVASWPEMHGVGMEVIRFVAFEEALLRCAPARPELAPQICERYFDDRFAALRPYPDVADVIAGLHRRLPLAIITNGNTHPQRLGLGDRFTEVVLALECGFHKPDPAIYAHSAALLGVDPGECLHVGDDPAEDVDAAARAGMPTVWLNREGRERWPARLPPPAAEIEDLAALPGLL